MKNIRPKFKVSTIAFLMAVTGLARGATLPSGPGASTGVTSINTSGNTMTINTNANKSIQNWNSFSVGSGGMVQINQPNSSSIMLNRATGGTMSQVRGTINSNGGVWLVNPQGIYFGPGSVVNAGSVLLSTLNIADASFSSNGSYNFTPSGSSGAIELNGSIQSSSLVAISPTIRQGYSGVLNASQEVHLLATDNAKLAIDSSGLIVANLNQSAAQTLLNTQGTVRTVNGHIELTAMGQALAAEALITVGGIVLTQGRNNNIYINAPYGSYAINGVISPGPGGILTVNYQTADDGESEANKKQAAQLTAGMGSEGEKNSLGSGLITDASERQARDGAGSENSNKFSENRERSEGRDGSDEGQRESRGDSRDGKGGKKNNKSEKGNKANRGGKEGKVTPGNPGNANNASNNTAPAFANPAGNVPASNAASNSAAANGLNPAGNPTSNILPVARDQIPYVNSQFVTLKPGAPPLIEKGYSIKPQLNNVDIKPLRTVDPVYRAAGPVTGTSNFNVNVRGNVLPYQVSTSENGLQIKPLSASAAKYAESNRSTVLKGAVNNAVDTLSATPGTFKTIYMDFN